MLQHNTLQRFTYAWLYVLFALRHSVPEHSELLRQRWHRTCEADLQMCPQCFANDPPNAIGRCSALTDGLQIPLVWPQSLLDLLGLNVREIQRGRLDDDGQSVYVKHTPLSDDIRTLLATANSHDDLTEQLSLHYLRNLRPDGLQILPLSAHSVQRFVHTFAATSQPTTTALHWLWLNAGAETMLMDVLEPLGFAVPAVLRRGGLVTAVADGGRPLAEWLNAAAVANRLRAVRELLVAALRFTKGVNGFR